MQQEALATAVVALEPGRRAEAKPGKEGAYAHYRLGRAYDEMFTADGRVRPHYAELHRRLAELSPEELKLRQQACEQSFLHQGITFTVYGDNQATERIIPTDLLPRIITAAEWARLEAGLKQRVAALNLFLHDIYSEGRVLKDGLVPRSMVYGSKHYRREMRGLAVPHGAYVNVCGTDLVRREDGVFVVLEDNLRVPSGVSYMLANREVVRRAFPAIFRSAGVRPIEHYPQDLLATLRSLAPFQDNVSIAVLSPGVFNSAYFEHAFLARQMGVELVEGRDLVVNDNAVYARTTSGLKRVDVIYRRIDDDFIDPLAFRSDSTLGRAGHLQRLSRRQCRVRERARHRRRRRQGDLRLCAATHPLLSRRRADPRECRDLPLPRSQGAVAHARQSRQARGQGGRRIGRLRHAGRTARDQGRARSVRARSSRRTPRTTSPSRRSSSRPRRALPTARSSRAMSICRPFILHGERTTIAPGALTRVALKRGSLVVNSSQGGGSKDTWVLSS